MVPPPHGPYTCDNAAGYPDLGEAERLFQSEFGVVGLPQWATLRNALSEQAGDLSVFSPVLRARLHAGAELNATISVNFGAPINYSDSSLSTFRTAIYLSQISQAESLKATVDGGRLGSVFKAAVDSEASSAMTECGSQGYGPSGYLFWQLQDIWQASSWGSLDFGGRWRLLHHAAVNFFSNVYGSCGLFSGPKGTLTVSCSAVNNGKAAVDENVTVSLASFDHGQVIWNVTFGLQLQPDCRTAYFTDTVANILDREPSKCAGGHLCWLYTTVTSDSMSAVAVGHVPLSSAVVLGGSLGKLLGSDIPHAEVVVEVGKANSTTAEVQVRASCSASAAYIWLTTDPLGRFGVNGFHLLACGTLVTYFQTLTPEPLNVDSLTKSLRAQWLNGGV
jgi:beta-mannosidase